MKYCLSPKDFSRAQAIFHCIPRLESQYSHSELPLLVPVLDIVLGEPLTPCLLLRPQPHLHPLSLLLPDLELVVKVLPVLGVHQFTERLVQVELLVVDNQSCSDDVSQPLQGMERAEEDDRVGEHLLQDPPLRKVPGEKVLQFGGYKKGV